MDIIFQNFETFQKNLDSPQVKWQLISSIKILYRSCLKSSQTKLRKLGNIRQVSKLAGYRAQHPVSPAEIKFPRQQSKITQKQVSKTFVAAQLCLIPFLSRLWNPPPIIKIKKGQQQPEKQSTNRKKQKLSCKCNIRFVSSKFIKNLVQCTDVEIKHRYSSEYKKTAMDSPFISKQPIIGHLESEPRAVPSRNGVVVFITAQPFFYKA